MEASQYCHNIHNGFEQLLCLRRTDGWAYDFFLPCCQSKQDQSARPVCWK